MLKTQTLIEEADITQKRKWISYINNISLLAYTLNPEHSTTNEAFITESSAKVYTGTLQSNSYGNSFYLAYSCRRFVRILAYTNVPELQLSETASTVG